MSCLIRNAVEEDAAAMVELLNPIIAEGRYTILDEQISVADQVEFIRRFPARGVFNVAVCEESGRLVGMQDVQPISPSVRAFDHVGEISTFVALDARGTGIGSSLSQATFRAAARLGVP